MSTPLRGKDRRQINVKTPLDLRSSGSREPPALP